MDKLSFEGDEIKNRQNQKKQGISFEHAQLAFFDTKRIITEDMDHSILDETRYYCFGKIGNKIATVRFTYRYGKIRICGVGYWRKGKKACEQENQIF